MFCSRCGQSIELTDAFCSRCGASNMAAATANRTENADSAAPKSPEQPSQTNEPFAGPAYTRADYNPAQPSSRPQPAASASSQKPGVTSMIIFSIINIVTFGFGISFILGIIALVFTLTASNSTNEAEISAKLHAAKTLNIVGLVIAILQFIAIVAIVIAIVTAAFGGRAF